MVSSEQHIFSTLFGIAVFAMLRRRYLLRNGEKKDMDIISQLPDEILTSIIALLSTKDAIKTSVLSKRWRDIYKFVPTVNLRCHDLVRCGDYDTHNPYLVIHRLRKFLLLRSGSKIRSFVFSCCLRNSHQFLFESCVSYLSNLGIEEFVLHFIDHPRKYAIPFPFSFSCHLLYEMQSLKHFHLKSCDLKPILKIEKHCNSLQTLKLTSVQVSDGALECILSNCLSLHTLEIEECSFPRKLCITGTNLRLKSLQINTCSGLEEIELWAPNLIRFDILNHEHVNFNFNHVPLLQTMFLLLHSRKHDDISYIRGILKKDLPHLKSLTFITTGEFYQMNIRYTDTHALKNLRRLDFCLSYRTKIDLLLLIPLLQSCPLLQEFHLDTSLLEYNSGAQVNKHKVGGLHRKLQRVEITGFDGTDNEMEFALYIVKSAVALEKLHILRCGKKYMGFDYWSYTHETNLWTLEDCEMIHRQLKEEIVSKKAQISVVCIAG